MTIAELQADLTLCVSTRDRIKAAGQSSSLDGVERTDPNLAAIEREIKDILTRISMLGAGNLKHSVACFGGSR